jgi:XTP/dITP diphosphohydrolase
MELVLATGNPYKVKEIAPILIKNGFKTRLQTEFFQDEAIEDGLSFLENALKKARFASQKTRLPALADDSGLEVDILEGAPGIFSARYAGENASDSENIDKLLTELAPYPQVAQRQARYTCAMVYVKSATDPNPLIGVGHLSGDILLERRTNSGIGYDDVVWVPSLLRAFSQVPLERKLQISHRTQALNAIIKQLNK